MHTWSTSTVDEVVPVGKDSWDQEGNFWAPAPGSRDYSIDCTKMLVETDEVRVQMNTFMGKHYTLWTKDKDYAELIKGQIEQHLGSTPTMELDSFLIP